MIPQCFSMMQVPHKLERAENLLIILLTVLQMNGKEQTMLVTLIHNLD
jgi:hypothetical protein